MERKAECACGRVSIVVEGDPVRVIACHCDYCQKRTGSVFQVSCWYPHERVLAVNGETKIFNDSLNSIGVDYEFCPNCGSTVHWTFGKIAEMPGMEGLVGIEQFRGIAVGCFADKTFPMPDVDTHTQYQHHWVPPVKNVPRYEAFAEPDILMQGL